MDGIRNGIRTRSSQSNDAIVVCFDEYIFVYRGRSGRYKVQEQLARNDEWMISL